MTGTPQPPIPDIPYHPCANIMPMMGADDRAALRARMQREGYNKAKPLVLLDGMLLDGRNRIEEARSLGLSASDISFRVFGEPDESGFDWCDGDDPLEFVLRENYDRRHLSVSQRSLVMAEAETLRHGGRRPPAGQDANLHLDLPGAATDAPAVPRADLAKRGGVSERSIATAAQVRDQGAPELKDAVREGTVTISTAADIATLPKDEQAEVVARGETEILKKAKEIRQSKQAKKHVERQHKGEALAAKNPGLPGRLYSFALIDVPRKHNVYDDETGSEKAPENHYPVMNFRELLDFAIDSFVAKDCIIAYWSTAASLLDDLEILAEWGFVAFRPRDANGKLIRDETGDPLVAIGGGKYGSQQVWHKRRAGKAMGTGRWFRDQHEFMIFARRGDIPAPLPGTQSDSCFDADFAGHSVKPHDIVRAQIDRCWPHMEKIEIFARAKPGEAPPAGWTFWGNEASAAEATPAERAGEEPARAPKEPDTAEAADPGTQAAVEFADELRTEFNAFEAIESGEKVDGEILNAFRRQRYLVPGGQTRITSRGYARRNELEDRLNAVAGAAAPEQAAAETGAATPTQTEDDLELPGFLRRTGEGAGA
jgi:N6-adenosine-specific RNA methylase IME4